MQARASTLSWRVVFIASLILVAALLTLWRGHECCSISGINALQTPEEIEAELQKSGSENLFRLTTGVYVQSLSFETANDVKVTGRIWQRLAPGEFIPEGAELGVLFPDATSKHDDNLTPIYQDILLDNGARLWVWNFQATLRQDFNYADYPLDGKLVWLRMWTLDVANKMQLVPDLGAYESSALDAGLGISETLVPGEWTVRESFYGFERQSYGTDFGRQSLKENMGKPIRPELRFYVVLQRNFIDAFLVNLVPLFVLFGLLFGLMMTISRNAEQAGKLGFNTMAVFGTCAGLFFIAVLGHIQIREQFAGSGMVYLEYFYICAFIALLFVSVFSFAITNAQEESKNWLLRNDGIIAKLMYWPVILAVLVVISLIQLVWVS